MPSSAPSAVRPSRYSRGGKSFQRGEAKQSGKAKPRAFFKASLYLLAVILIALCLAIYSVQPSEEVDLRKDFPSGTSLFLHTRS